MSKQKILVFIDWYLPGYKAGGPIQSCANIISHLKDQYDFSVVTRDTDYTDTIPYAGIQSDTWLKWDGTPVYYCSNSLSKIRNVKRIIEEEKYDVVYFNSLFSIYFTILPLLWLWMGNTKAKIILAPRGMLADGALSLKPVKKAIFIKLFNLLGVFKKILFHASSASEAQDIKKNLGPNTAIRTASNLLSKGRCLTLRKRYKEIGKLQLVYISRIAPEKNLKYALALLSKIKYEVVFDIYGPIYNDLYWSECQSLIHALPRNVTVNYKSFLNRSQVYDVLQDYHLLILPTLGENFGHVILEALNAGCPVLISDKTPWRELHAKGIGADISLENEGLFVETMNAFCEQSQETFDEWSKNAQAFALAYNNDITIIEQNRKLFDFGESNRIPNNAAIRKILVFIDWYKPGYRAGGPIRSVTNIISHFRDEFDFSVVTSNTDYKVETPYTNVDSNQWNILPSGTRVFYFSKDHLSYKSIKKIILEEEFDTIYLNSFFSYYFTILPIVITKRYRKDKPIILAPRGMLSEAALSLKFWKKYLFMKLAKFWGIYKGVVWHASTDKEEAEIRKVWGNDVEVVTALNLSYSKNTEIRDRIKIPGQLRLVYLSRITRKKQLLAAIEYLEKMDNRIQVSFEIYGPIEDKDYWRQVQKAMDALPMNIKAEYKGIVNHYEVEYVYLNNHFLLFPTLNENFGHVIIESFSLGCPVIISDKTPWVGLEHKKVGWDIDLAQPQQFVEVLNYCGNMGQEEYMIWSKSAFEYAQEIKNDQTVIHQNRKLFIKMKN